MDLGGLVPLLPCCVLLSLRSQLSKSSEMTTNTTTSSLLSTLPKDIPASFLKQITNDFSPELELGKGAFGTVSRYDHLYAWNLFLPSEVD